MEVGKIRWDRLEPCAGLVKVLQVPALPGVVNWELEFGDNWKMTYVEAEIAIVEKERIRDGSAIQRIVCLIFKDSSCWDRTFAPTTFVRIDCGFIYTFWANVDRRGGIQGEIG